MPNPWGGMGDRGIGAPGLQDGGTAPTRWVGASLLGLLLLLFTGFYFSAQQGFVLITAIVGSCSQVLALDNPLCLRCGFFQTSQTPVSGNSSALRQLPVGRE